MKNENDNIFWTFSEKYGKKSKKVKNDEKRVRYWWKRSKLIKNEKNNIFWTFSEKYGKKPKKVKNDEII